MTEENNLKKKLNELEDKYIKLEKRVTKLETPKSEMPKLSSLEGNIKQKIHEIGIQHLVLFSLKLKSKQSRDDIQSKLLEWDKPVGKWFSGGNFRNRLLKKSLLIIDGKNNKGGEVYSLGIRGIKAVNELIKKYDLK